MDKKPTVESRQPVQKVNGKLIEPSQPLSPDLALLRRRSLPIPDAKQSIQADRRDTRSPGIRRQIVDRLARADASHGASRRDFPATECPVPTAADQFAADPSQARDGFRLSELMKRFASGHVP